MIWKRTKDILWALPPNILEEVLEQAKLENKGLGEISALLGEKAQATEKKIEGRIAVIPIQGPLQKTGNIFSRIFRFTTYDALASEISTCVRAPEIDTIILQF